GGVELAAPARAERREDLVGAEARAGGESHVVGLCGDRANCTGDTRAALGQMAARSARATRADDAAGALRASAGLYGHKALGLSIRGGAGRNHTGDRIQP